MALFICRKKTAGFFYRSLLFCCSQDLLSYDENKAECVLQQKLFCRGLSTILNSLALSRSLLSNSRSSLLLNSRLLSNSRSFLNNSRLLSSRSFSLDRSSLIFRRLLSKNYIVCCNNKQSYGEQRKHFFHDQESLRGILRPLKFYEAAKTTPVFKGSGTCCKKADFFLKEKFYSFAEGKAILFLRADALFR